MGGGGDLSESFRGSEVWCPSQGNYKLEVLVKTPRIYQVSELRNLILFIFRGVKWGVCGFSAAFNGLMGF